MPSNLFDNALKKKPITLSEIKKTTPCTNEGDYTLALSDHVLSGSQISSYKTEPPTIWINPFLTSGSIVVVYAKRGVGKTWFIQQLAVSISKCMPFLDYEVPHTGKVLTVDGEMRIQDLQYRLGQLTEHNIPDNISILSSEVLSKNDISIDLNKKDCQGLITDLIDKTSPDVIIFDNLSSLSFGRDENSNSDLDSLLQFLRNLRHKNLAVIIVHHAGKNGTLRGASRLEDIVDYSIELRDSKTYTEKTAFQAVFTKCRGEKPFPHTPICTLTESGSGLELVCEAPMIPLKNQTKIIMALNDKQYKNQTELADDLGLNKGTVSKEIKVLHQLGFISKKPLKNTTNGEQYLKDIISKL